MPKANDSITDKERSRRFIEKARELGGKAPRALQRSTWKASVSCRASLPSTRCKGVFETSPPSQ